MTTGLRAVMLGTGKHAEVLMDCLQSVGIVPECALDAAQAQSGRTWLGIPVLGSDELMPELPKRGISHFVVGVGGVGDNSARRRVFTMALAAGLRPLSVIHPRAIVSRTAQLGEGVQLLAGSIVSTGAVIGSNVLVNTGAIVEHHCRIRDHAHIASGACVAGSVSIGEGAHIGAGATVRQSLRIGDEAVVGAGAVVIRDVPPRTVVVGVPAVQRNSGQGR